MAAIALENANLVRQRVKIALADANPVIQESAMALLTYLATQKGNPDLQFIPYAAADIDTGADGYNPVDGAGKVHFVYGKRVSDVDTTAAFLAVLDDATDNSTAADALVALRSDAASEAMVYLNPVGKSFAAGLVVAATTTIGGTTESAATESSNGFIIISQL